MNGTSMILGAFQHFQSRDRKKGIQPAKKTKQPNYSWLPIYEFLEEVDANTYAGIASHYVNGIDEVSQKPQVNISGDLVGQEISGYQLLGLCFSGRLDGSESGVDRARVYRRKRGACAVVSAMRGYFPAQAICSQLQGGNNDRFRKTWEDNDTKWQRNAVASGFLLGWKFAHENPEEYALALSDFRQSGGYNTHYAYNTMEKESAYSPSGLLYDVQFPFEWLRNYPLHKAAALGQTAEVKRLVDNGYDINSLDISGETPLQRACMAGHASTTRCLVQRGADVTLKSKLLGTVPLHWLFVFEPNEANDIADILAGRQKETLEEESNIEADAFHFPFKWPSGSPIAWSVLSNRYDAISALLRLGSSLDSIPDFFPSLPDWPEDVDSYDIRSSSRQNRNLFKAWIYNPILQYQHPIYQNSFRYVVKRGALESLEELSRNRIDSRVVDSYGGELQTAVVEGDLDAVRELINSGADVNFSPGKKDTPLLAAIAAKNPDIVKMLLDNEAKVDFPPDIFSGSPLQRAAKTGNMQITRMLLDAGADVNSQSQRTDLTGTALYEASRLGGIDIIEMLLEKGADCSIIGGVYGTPLQRAACAERVPLEKVKLLLKHGANPNVRAGYYETALQAAASEGNAGVVKALLEAGADPNIEGGNLWTALQAAVIPSNRSHEILDILLERKVDVNAVGGDYGTAIQAAASGGDESLVEKLLRAGALPNVRGGRHGTALQAAAWTGNLKLVQLLLEAGADPDIGGGLHDKTPLEAAVVSGDEAMVKLLLSNGADPNLLGGVDKVLLGIERRGREVGGMEQILLDWGARPSSENIPPVNHLHPLSWLEVEHVRNLLNQRLQIVSKGNAIPKHLPDMILRRAQYLPQISARNDNPEQITQYTTEEAYLRIYIENTPSDIKPHQIYFEIQSHDNGNVKPSQRDGPYGKSDTFFEVGVYFALTGKTKRIHLQRNFHGSRCLRTHKVIWDIHAADPMVSNTIKAFMPGDELRVFAKSLGDNINYVESMEVRVLYHYSEAPKGQISAPSVPADGQQAGPGGGMIVKPAVPYPQHPNGAMAYRAPTSGSQPAASSNQ